MGPGLRKQDRASIRYGDLTVMPAQDGISGDKAQPCALEIPASAGMTIRLSISQTKIPQGPRIMQRIMRNPAVRRRTKSRRVDQLQL
jgi:hypothetical protein